MKNKTLIFVLCILVASGLCYIDITMIGPEMTFVLLYLIPISLSAWFSGRRAGIALALLCSSAWFTVYTFENPNFSDYIPYLNLSTKIMIYTAFVIILSELKYALKRGNELSLTDFITGAANTRAFMQLLEKEIQRAERYKHPLTMLFMDIDNFKSINDRFGHSAGDKLLRLTVEVIRENIRSSDMVARMGGDEFAILMPETDLEAAKNVVQKIQLNLMSINYGHGRGITFSIGVVTYLSSPPKADEIVKTADMLMYEIKNAGKNSVKYKSVG